jgi:L-threonylcarbamoyladenylate synthase
MNALMSEYPRHATVLAAHTPALFDAAVRRATELLRAGEVVALPTETVYGLAANALDSKAVRRIFEIKQRPAHNPIIVHVSDLTMARRCVSDWPALANDLAASFWPGPLTLVLRRAPVIPDEVTAGGDTVGVRAPSHPLMQAVIRACGFPLAAPSANLANELSPTNAEHVLRSLGPRIPLIIDGGQSQVGIESTVLDITTKPPRLLRPGMIHDESLVAVAGKILHGGTEGETLRSPGMLKKHYSPRARLMVQSWKTDDDLHALTRELTAQKKVFVIAHTHIPAQNRFASVSVIPHDAEAFARAIYSELHRCDAQHADVIIVERVPDEPAWRGIADRLQRAAVL